MTGFIRGLFSGKKQSDGGNQQASAPQPKGAYFLEPDDAKTFGNIDYMRKTKTIERTFPKGKPQVSQVSATSYQKVDEAKFSSRPASGSAAPTQPSFSSQPSTSFQPSSFTPPKPSFNQGAGVKKTKDSGMDMFRKMAKDIKKR